MIYFFQDIKMTNRQMLFHSFYEVKRVGKSYMYHSMRNKLLLIFKVSKIAINSVV